MNIQMYRTHFEIQKKHWWLVTKKKIVLSFIERYTKKPAPAILDIGCGSGLMLNALEKLGQTHGMDMSDEAIAFSKEIFSGTVKKGSLPNDLPYPEKSFDLITALDVIEHVDDDVAALKSLHARLTDHGKMVITVPACMSLWSAFDTQNEHKRRYSRTELKSKILEAGYSIEKISYYNTILFPVAYVVRKLNNLFKKDGASDLDMPGVITNFILKKIFGLEDFFLKFINFPIGVSLIAVVRKD